MSKKKEKSSLMAEKIVSDSAVREKEPLETLKGENLNAGFIENLKSATEGLWYMSETDAEIKVFIGKKSDSVSKENLLEQIEISTETSIEENTFEDFFKNLTEIQDWFGDEEKATAVKFSELETLLEENLKDLKVFKVGQIEIDIYVVGLDSQNRLMGITTKAVET